MTMQANRVIADADLVVGDNRIVSGNEGRCPAPTVLEIAGTTVLPGTFRARTIGSRSD